MSQLITVQEAAKLLKVSDLTVRRYISQGRLKASKINSRDIRIVESDLQEFIATLTRGTADE